MAVPLGLEVFYEGGLTTVVVRGELDAATAPDLDSLLASLAAAGAREVVLDLAEVAFADSYGLEPVLRRRERFADLVLARPTRPVRHLLAVLNLVFSTTPGVVEKAAVA